MMEPGVTSETRIARDQAGQLDAVHVRHAHVQHGDRRKDRPYGRQHHLMIETAHLPDAQ